MQAPRGAGRSERGRCGGRPPSCISSAKGDRFSPRIRVVSSLAKLIPNAIYRQYVTRIPRIRFELTSQVLHVYVYHSVERFHLQSADGVE